MRFVCLITKATDTHSEYVILIALPRQQWLRERAWMLRYTYIACLVIHSAKSSCHPSEVGYESGSHSKCTVLNGYNKCWKWPQRACDRDHVLSLKVFCLERPHFQDSAAAFLDTCTGTFLSPRINMPVVERKWNDNPFRMHDILRAITTFGKCSLPVRSEIFRLPVGYLKCKHYSVETRPVISHVVLYRF
jgi:hypothetical protein